MHEYKKENTKNASYIHGNASFLNIEALLGVLGSREQGGKNYQEQGGWGAKMTGRREMMKWNLGVI